MVVHELMNLRYRFYEIEYEGDDRDAIVEHGITILHLLDE